MPLLYTAATKIHIDNKYKHNKLSLEKALDHIQKISTMDDHTSNELILQAFVADTTAAGENTLNYRQAMKADDKDQFEEEMEKEMERFAEKD